MNRQNIYSFLHGVQGISGRKRVLSLLLCVVVAFAVLPGSCWALEHAGNQDGTQLQSDAESGITEEMPEESIAESEDGVGSASSETVQVLLGPTDIPFTDIDHWGREAIEYCWKAGIVEGTGPDTFSPNQLMSRAMFITLLYRCAGEPEVSDGP